MACRKENGNQILLKMGCWYLKTLRMENLMTWNHLKNRNWKIISKRGWKLLFWNQRERVWGGWHRAQKVAMHMDLRCKWYPTLKLVIAVAIFSFLIFWKATRWADRDLLFLRCGLVLGGHSDNSISVNIKYDFNLRHVPWELVGCL